MAESTPISKVRTSDGVVHDFSTSHTLIIPDSCLDKLNVTWNITNWTGSVSLISGTTDDYLMTINEQRS